MYIKKGNSLPKGIIERSMLVSSGIEMYGSSIKYIRFTNNCAVWGFTRKINKKTKIKNILSFRALHCTVGTCVDLTDQIYNNLCMARILAHNWPVYVTM